MKLRFGKLAVLAMLTAAMVVPSLPALAEEDLAALKARIEKMEKDLAEMRQLLEQKEQVAKDDTEVQALRKEVAQLKSSQEEITQADSVVHLAGYGSVGYTDAEGDNGSFGAISFNPIFHYLYKDLLLFEAELELEIEDDGETETGLEYSVLNLLLHDYVTFSAGKFLSPIGSFRRNLHPAWINKLPSRPPGFSGDQAAPVAEIGVMLRGGIPVPAVRESYINYALYVGNGPKLELNEAEDEVESIDTEGFPEDPDGDKVFGGRLGFLPIPGLELGVSGAFSEVAVDQSGEPDRDYYVLDFDFAMQWHGLDFRGEYALQKLDKASSSVAPDRQRWSTYYLQAAYKLAPTNFEPVIRYTKFDSTHADQEQEQWTLGLNYLFAPNAIAKFAYEFNDGQDDEPTDADRLLLQFAYGF